MRNFKITFMGKILLIFFLVLAFPFPAFSGEKPVASLYWEYDFYTTDQTVKFDASGSYDPDGWIEKYGYVFGNGDEKITTEDVIFYSYDYTGIYRPELHVIDNDALTDKSVTFQIGIGKEARYIGEIVSTNIGDGGWVINVSKVLEGPQPCSSRKVVAHKNAHQDPDDPTEVGDRVEAYGIYVGENPMFDEGCGIVGGGVTREEYYLREINSPPSPDPMSWNNTPHATGTGTIEMEATDASDPEGTGVEYRFRETTGHYGGSDSGWQNGRNYTDSGLSSDTRYCYQVKARDKSSDLNETDWSSEKCARTDQEEDTVSPDTSITNGPSGTINHNDVNFSWTGTDNHTPTSNLVYSYKMEGEDSSWSSWTGSTSTNYSGLSDGSYTFKVKAKDSAGNVDSSPASREFTVHTGSDVPAPPSNLKANAVSSTMINLSWFDNSGNENGFNIYRDGNKIDSVSSNTEGYSDKNLNNNTEYCYRVSAYNSGGESSKSNQDCATTSQEPNNPPNANSDTYTVPKNSSDNRLYVLANDSDPDGDKISLDRIVSSPNHGNASIVGRTIYYTPDTDYTGSDSLTYEISDSEGLTDQATVELTVVDTGANFWETGRVEVDDNWTRVYLNNTYSNPVVVAKPASYNDSQPTTVRLDYTSSSSFRIRLQEWDYLDGNHNFETVSYLVVESGHHALDGGFEIDAGQIKVSGAYSFYNVDFNSSFPSTPVVFSSVATFNGGDTVATRNKSISKSGFKVRMQEQEAKSPSHVTEIINYIALEQGSGTLDGASFEAGTTGNNVNNSWQQISLSFGGSTTVQVDEETSDDKETHHETENVGYFALNTYPLIFLGDMQTADGEDTANLRFKLSSPQPQIATFDRGTWWVDANSNGEWDGPKVDIKVTGYGIAGNQVAIADLDNDGTDELATFKAGNWWIDINDNYKWDGPNRDKKLSGFGTTGNKVAAGDFDGDGKAEIATFNGGTWWIDMNNNITWDGEPTDKKIDGFGNADNQVAAADFDGDGKAEIATFTAGTWWIDLNNNDKWDGPDTDKKVEGYGTAGNIVAAGNLPAPSSVATNQLTQPAKSLKINGALAYPNPVTGSDHVTFRARGQNIQATKLNLFTASGEPVYATGYKPGTTITWNLTTNTGEPVSNGIYLYQVTGRDESGRTVASQFKKLLVVK